MSAVAIPFYGMFQYQKDPILKSVPKMVVTGGQFALVLVLVVVVVVGGVFRYEIKPSYFLMLPVVVLKMFYIGWQMQRKMKNISWHRNSKY